jgi:phosphoribosylanthranilate isomerase
MTGPRVKICGVTRPDDAAAVAAAGADYVGLNFWSESKRRVDLGTAPAIARAARDARPGVQIVGLFVDSPPDAIQRVQLIVGLDVIQLHGDETPERCRAIAATTGLPVWKAVAVTGPEAVADLGRWPVDAILLDAPSVGRGGSGRTVDWAVAADAVRRHPGVEVVLAGGLTPDNVAAAIARVGPWAVDVASGVEIAPGEKDADRVRAFVRAARGEEPEQSERST